MNVNEKNYGPTLIYFFDQIKFKFILRLKIQSY